MKGKLKRNKLAEKISRALDIPVDGISRAGVVELRGNGDLLITGCACILEYDSDKIVVAAGDKVIMITGTDMTMMTFTDSCVCVKGTISAIYPNRDSGDAT